MAVKVAFCVAGNKWQQPKWWSVLAAELARAAVDPNVEVTGLVTQDKALPDFNKNQVVQKFRGEKGVRRDELTDVNRNKIIKAASLDRPDYYYWWDDDTAHPPGTLQRLLALGKPFVSGLYYLKQPPCTPIAYFRNDNGSYRPLDNFRRGELVEVDSVGMGCALVAAEVYAAIRDGHDVYHRPNHSLLVLPKGSYKSEDVRVAKALDRQAGNVVNGVYLEPVGYPLTDEEIDAHPFGFTYYAMEYSRTEDHYFCEHAENVGYKPLVDTSINCQHWGPRPVTRDSFLEFERPARRAAQAGGDDANT